MPVREERLAVVLEVRAGFYRGEGGGNSIRAAPPTKGDVVARSETARVEFGCPGGFFSPIIPRARTRAARPP